MKTLDKKVMIDSYRNISFSGEQRGESDFNYYNDLLAKDLEALGENSGRYAEKFCEKVMAIYSAKSRTASAFIVGPAKFPTARNQKANDAERRAIDHFKYWREKYFKLVNRVRKQAPIDDIEKHKKEIERFEAIKEKYKAEGYGSQDWRISNTNATIRYHKKKIEALQNRIGLSESFNEIIVPDGRIYFSNERLVVEHNEKPSSEVIALIRGHSFRYSPRTKTWVRQFTQNAVYDAQNLAKKLNEIKAQ